MLKDLVSRFRKGDDLHPLATDQGLRDLLSGIPGSDPERRLFDIDHWLGEVEPAAREVELHRLMKSARLLDESALPVVGECLALYFDPKAREHLSERVWQTVYAHCERLVACNLYLLGRAPAPADVTPADRRYLLPLALRTMHWHVRAKALLRLRYRTPAAGWWRTAHDLLARAHILGVAALKAVPYEGGTESSVWHEYARGAYLELAPWSNLAPEQVETLDRVLGGLVAHLVLKAGNPQAGGHSVDLTATAGPVRTRPEAMAGDQWRHLNTAPAYAQILQLASRVRSEKAMPDWLQGAPGSVQDNEAMLRAVLTAWSRQPPKRRHERRTRHDRLLVVNGFALARRMVAFSDFARSGRNLEYGSDLQAALRDRLERRFTTANVNLEKPPEEVPVEPLDTLRKLELSGDKAMMEQWALADVSDSGIGAAVPHVRTTHRIGGLVGFRQEDSLDWRLGLIRRIGRGPDGKQGIGLETLPGPSVCAQVKPASESGKTVWQQIEGSGLGYLDAMLLAPDGDQLVLPAGAFRAELVILLRVGGEERSVVLTELRDRGTDFERVLFRPGD
ncbi:MAG TPA: hypothetical protein PK375_05395 [Rhodocyclaceae bacterium]|nr:hypothetical protein [Rhodocyclaceae bacterium]